MVVEKDRDILEIDDRCWMLDDSNSNSDGDGGNGLWDMERGKLNHDGSVLKLSLSFIYVGFLQHWRTST
jgi:hypothetical protein